MKGGLTLRPPSTAPGYTPGTPTPGPKERKSAMYARAVLRWAMNQDKCFASAGTEDRLITREDQPEPAVSS